MEKRRLRHSEGYLEVPHSLARGSSRLYQQSWSPDGDTRAAVLLVHGLGEHSSRYAHVADHLTQHSFSVHMLDHYGHGKSDVTRAMSNVSVFTWTVSPHCWKKCATSILSDRCTWSGIAWAA